MRCRPPLTAAVLAMLVCACGWSVAAAADVNPACAGRQNGADRGAAGAVKMAASEDNLRYPNMLNEQYDAFAGTLDTEDFGPTESQRQVFAYLHEALAGELAKSRAVSDADLPALQALMRDHGVPSIVATP